MFKIFENYEESPYYSAFGIFLLVFVNHMFSHNFFDDKYVLHFFNGIYTLFITLFIITQFWI